MSRRSSIVLALLALAANSAPAQSDVLKLDPVPVFAGQFPTGESPGAVLNSLDIVTTPSANADINRALQTLPGVQLVDEGNALFVRGGDSFETITLVNGLRSPAATRLDTPVGNFAGTLNPFAARKIDFTSGGFGARYGNALSGVVDIDTIGAPGARVINLGGGLGALSAGLSLPVPGYEAGLRVTATRSSTQPIFRLNGSSRSYLEAPNGHEYSATFASEYRSGAEVKLFTVEQLNRFALDVNSPTEKGAYRQSNFNRLTVLSWKDTFGAWTARLSLGGGEVTQDESVAGQQTDSQLRHRQLAGRVEGDITGDVHVAAGFDATRQHTALDEVIPAVGHFAVPVEGSRAGGFAEVDAVVAPRLRVITGLRLDHATRTDRTTADPRLALAWAVDKQVSFSLAGGTYHQIPDDYDFVDRTGLHHRPPMRANQLLAGLQVGKDDQFARVEVYTKNYADLIALNRSYLPAAGGSGRAEGADVILKSPLPGGARGRLTVSWVDTRRTDPDTRVMARAPFDVTRTAALIVDRSFSGWLVGTAVRYADGRPFTPVTGAVSDGAGGYAPVYGAPESAHLPALVRLDLSASRYIRLNRHTALVLYASVNNVLNHTNVYSYTYADDYSARQAVPSLFKRILYLGFSLELL